MNRHRGQIHHHQTKPSAAANPPADAGPSPLRSVHTTNFPAILDNFGSSLLVTTYQAGKLVVVRSDGGVINTHFRAFNKPMGLAVGRGRAVDRHGRRRVGISQCAGRRGQARAAEQARRVLPAPLGPRHRRHANPRDGLRRRRGAVRQHAVLAASPCTTRTTASPPPGGRSSSPPSRPTTAATSTACVSSTAGRDGSRRWAKPTPPAAGAKTRKAAAS